MTATKKLTKPEACAELARRMDYTVVGFPQPDGDGLYYQAVQPNGIGVLGYDRTSETALQNARDFFTSRDAAFELVVYLSKGNGSTFNQFTYELLASSWQTTWRKAISLAIDCSVPVIAEYLLLATPEQITLAACAALGIELEDEAK